MKEAIDKAVEVLKKGGVILYPTDTVWGLGCDATNEKAVKRIFEIKQREEAKSMIILLSDLNNVGRYVREVPEMAYSLWEVTDKPLTLILPDAVGVAEQLIDTDEKTIAIRVTQFDFIKNLLYKFKGAIVSTSANISGEATPAKFSQISENIIAAVDYCVPQEFENGSTKKPSSIIKLGLTGEITIIRE